MVDLPGRSVPVYDTMGQAVSETNADVSVIYVPARFAAAAIVELPMPSTKSRARD